MSARKPLSAHRKPRGRFASILIEHDGRSLTIYEWSKLTGLNYQTIWGRYDRNLRGAALLEPTIAANLRRAAGRLSAQLDDVKQLANMKRAIEDKKAAVSQQRRDRERDRRAAVEVGYLKAFLPPLIDDALLTDAERVANFRRVRNSGQRSWRVTGASMGVAL